MTDITLERLAEIEALEQAATAAETLTVFRYEHGGGRVCVIEGDNRQLVADLYDEPNREMWVALRNAAPALLALARESLERRENPEAGSDWSFNNALHEAEKRREAKP